MTLRVVLCYILYDILLLLVDEFVFNFVYDPL